jgi:hypothetical protein
MRLITIAAAVAVLASATAHAETLTFTTVLKGSEEVPPNDTTGMGEVRATLDTSSRVLTYRATYSGLTGDAIAAHFHAPAAAGTNAPPMIPMTSLASPISGSVTLTDAQIADLEAGKWYFNVHTVAHKGGEIRGQMMSGR